VFWLAVSSIASIPLVSYEGAPSFLIGLGLVFTAIYLVVAYLCWKLNPRGYIAAIGLGLFVIVVAVTVSGLRYPGDELLVVVQLLVILFGFRAYRELPGNGERATATPQG
jgi:predicted branched-subunit amino acid permease